MKILDIPQSGSVGGVTSGRNRNGQYRRSRSAPVQPRSPAQLLARSRLADASAGFRGLTNDVRAAWASFAATFSRTDALGQANSPTAHQAFVSAWVLDKITGQAAPTAPPARMAFVGQPVTGFTVVAGAVAIQGAAPAAGTFLQIMASGPMSAGRGFCGAYRFVKLAASADTFPLVITTSYNAVWGAVATGSKVFLRVRQVSLGQADTWAEFVAIATAS